MVHFILPREGLTFAKKRDAVTYSSFWGRVDRAAASSKTHVTKWPQAFLEQTMDVASMTSQRCSPVSDWDFSAERSEALIHIKSGFRTGADPNKLLRWKEERVQDPHPAGEARYPQERPHGQPGAWPRGAQYRWPPQPGVSYPSTSPCACHHRAAVLRAGPELCAMLCCGPQCVERTCHWQACCCMVTAYECVWRPITV